MQTLIEIERLFSIRLTLYQNGNTQMYVHNVSLFEFGIKNSFLHIQWFTVWLRCFFIFYIKMNSNKSSESYYQPLFFPFLYLLRHNCISQFHLHFDFSPNSSSAIH